MFANICKNVSSTQYSRTYIGSQLINLFSYSFVFLVRSYLRQILRESVRIRSYSGPHFPVFGLDTERYSVSLRKRSECRKMRTRINPNTDTFYAVKNK